MRGQLFGEARAGMRVLVVHAHPDDEVWATGAALAVLASRGCQLRVLVASGGEASEAGRAEEDGRAARGERLCASAAALGVQEWDWLAEEGRWVDTGGRPSPRSLTSARAGDLADAVLRQVERFRPELMLTVGSDGLTGHPDHILVHRAVLQAAGRTCPQVPVFGAHLLHGDVERGHSLLRTVLPETESVGSGRCAGIAPHPQLRTVVAPASVSEQRRVALDHYISGLGTRPLQEFVLAHPARGDSLLLRGVLDAVGGHIEHYLTYPRPTPTVLRRKGS